MASHVTTSTTRTGWIFKCDCGAYGYTRNHPDKAERDRRAHMAAKHPRWDLSRIGRRA